MDVLRRRLSVPSLDDLVKLHCLFDVHMGVRGCAEEKFRADVAAIAEDPRAVAILGGDVCDFIGPHDRKRWDPYGIADGFTIADTGARWGEACTERFLEAAAPLASEQKVLFGVLGNHELGIDDPVHDWVCRGMGCPALGYTALVGLEFVDPSGRTRALELAVTHGAGGATKPGTKLARLIETMRDFDAQLVLMGHIHACLDHWLARLRRDGSAIGDTKQLGVVCGTYLRTYVQGHSGYGERRLYSPTALKHAVIEIHPESMTMTVGWV